MATLNNLSAMTGASNLLDKIITVGNKWDLVQDVSKHVLPVSAKTGQGKLYNFNCLYSKGI